MPPQTSLVVLVVFGTIPVLSAVFRGGSDYEPDTQGVFSQNATGQKLGNSTSEVNVGSNVNNTELGEARNYPDEELTEEARKKSKPDIMSRILPMMIIPFMLQTAIIPMMLMMLKIMLIKSAFIGKMAILLGFLNLFRNSNNEGGVYTHNIQLDHHGMDEKLAEQHYGYHGHDEYGAYVSRRRRSYR